MSVLLVDAWTLAHGLATLGTVGLAGVGLYLVGNRRAGGSWWTGAR